MSNITSISSGQGAGALLTALAEQLSARGVAFDLVVVGGSALLVLGLTVRFASRLDQVHLKLYAAVDASTPGKHAADLRALEPTRDELVAAARWSLTHDPSDGYRAMLERALAYFGVEDADLGA